MTWVHRRKRSTLAAHAACNIWALPMCTAAISFRACFEYLKGSSPKLPISHHHTKGEKPKWLLKPPFPKSPTHECTVNGCEQTQGFELGSPRTPRLARLARGKSRGKSSGPRGEQPSQWAFGRARSTAQGGGGWEGPAPASIGQDASFGETHTKGDDEPMQPCHQLLRLGKDWNNSYEIAT